MKGIWALDGWLGEMNWSTSERNASLPGAFSLTLHSHTDYGLPLIILLVPVCVFLTVL